MKQITLTFDHVKDTDNNRRYQERVEGDASPRLGNGALYVSKELDAPDSIKVTIKAA
jgi:hypothetical protein